MKITTDVIVGTGLVTALILSIFTDGSTELQTTLASGLVGFLGRSALEQKEG